MASEYQNDICLHPTMAIERLVRAEVPLAYAAFVFTIIVIVWKTVGLSFIPGFDEIWGGRQYPRRGEEFHNYWQVFYLIMYGLAGAIAQYAGLMISVDSKNRTFNNAFTANRARRLEAFHVLIAAHHTAWSLTRRWGRLDLSSFHLPLGGFLLFGIVGVWTGYHGLCLITQSDDFDAVVRHKTLVDASSLMTLIELVGFLPANWIGYRNDSFERIMWIITVMSPLIMFVVDAWTERRVANKAKGKGA